MSNWTSARSILLSQLLDDVVGTEEMVHIRQDFCRIFDCINSTLDTSNNNTYYTGSKAEGLDLPGSDDDVMIDINNLAKLLIIQQIQDVSTLVQRNDFYMKTENAPPCFVMLKSLNEVQCSYLFDACQLLDNAIYLSSYLLVHNNASSIDKTLVDETFTKQGPSIERGSPYMDTSQPGIDNVLSIYCQF